MEKQRTISKPVAFSGIGLHTGNTSTITFHPAPADYGYVFVRTDINGNPEIPALVDYVVDLSRGTTLGLNGVQVHTVEHVLASLAGLKIDNCRIELDSNEPPVVDGSSMPYVEAILSAGIKELDKPRKYFEIKETVRYKNDAKHTEIVALPTNDYRITVMVDYFNPALGSQHTGMFDLEREFVTEFAPARTFCFLTEVQMLFKNGLIKGGSLDSAIVIVDKEVEDNELSELKELFKLDLTPSLGDNGILNGISLRFKNEPARHKLLDMIGDLALVGIPLKGQILAARPGHYSNIEFGKLIRKQYLEALEKEKYDPSKATEVVYDINQIMEILPHRYPFLLVDRVISYDEQTDTIIAYKNITINEPFFTGHFPVMPVFPGVLIMEALAQVGGIILAKKTEDYQNKLAFYMGIKNAKFRRPVVPGDQMVMEVKLIYKRFNTFTFHGKAMVSGQIVAEAEFQAAVVDRK